LPKRAGGTAAYRSHQRLQPAVDAAPAPADSPIPVQAASAPAGYADFTPSVPAASTAATAKAVKSEKIPLTCELEATENIAREG